MGSSALELAPIALAHLDLSELVALVRISELARPARHAPVASTAQGAVVQMLEVAGYAQHARLLATICLRLVIVMAPLVESAHHA